MSALELQRRSLRVYGRLLAEAEARQMVWAGKLVVMAGAGAAGRGVVAAASIAGAATLAIENDRAVVRAALREGEVDFVVNTLDEALRVLKNQLRLGRPLGVALTMDVAQAVDEAAERGLKPDFVFEMASGVAIGLPGVRLAMSGAEADAAVERWIGGRGWREFVVRAKDAPALRRVDAGLVERMSGDDPRVGWVRGIVRYQRSAGGVERVIWLSEEERAVLGNEAGELVSVE